MSKPQMIGHYRVVELLGTGAMGNVHAAVDTLIEREVAIKSLRPELTQDRESLQRLRAEAKSLARLSHPNITTLYQLLDGGNLYMVMELVRGRALDEILRDRQSPLGVKESLAIIAQAADGLSYAHQMGVIHRDIKPSNMMIADNGRVKVMDFGIARVRGSVRLTRAGTAIGTWLYAPPEQCRGDEGDERSDIYALAMVLYELLAGHPAFTSETDYTLIQAQINAHPPPLVPHTPGVTPQLESAIMTALAKRPEQRFATVRAFSDAIGATALRADAPSVVQNAAHLLEVATTTHEVADAQALMARALAWVKSRSAALGRRFKRLHPAIQGVTVASVGVAILAPLFLGLEPSRSPDRPAPKEPPRVARTEPAVVGKAEPPVVVKTEPSVVSGRSPADEPGRQGRGMDGPRAELGMDRLAIETAMDIPRAEAKLDKPRAETARNSTFSADDNQPSSIPSNDAIPKANDITMRFDRLEKAAKAGDQAAAYELGMLYLKTPGRQKLAEAFKWLKMSAEAGQADAQATLGKMYQNGDAEGGENYDEAVRWYTKAADQYNAEGQYWLGRAYELGKGGLKKDRKTAEHYYFLAKTQGHIRAKADFEKLQSSRR
jgi:tRNA A-37 threonylcarbamoyl transferase component Bud32